MSDKENAFFQGITRREFIHRTAVLCGGTATASAFWPVLGMAATPKAGGILRAGIGHGSTSDSLDPGSFNNNFTLALNFAINNHLAETDASGNLVPELAESWEASQGAVKWIFNLRRGVEFHNGKTLDAYDVVASINHHRGQDSKSSGKSLLADVDTITTDGPNKVIFKLKSGNADFPFIASSYPFAILPAKNGKIDASSGIGAGGYILENFEPGVRCTLKRYPNYWKPGKAHFKEIEFIAIVDLTARTTALKTGQIDVMDRCDVKTAHLLDRASGVSVKETSGRQHFTLPMRTDTAPFSNNDVRLALKHAINREEIVAKVLMGHGVVGNDQPISAITPFYANDIPQRTYDPEKAKWYLKKAGMSNLQVSLHVADAAFAGAVDTALLYREHAAKAGIDIKVIREPNDGYWSNVWMKKPWSASYWWGRPTANGMFTIAYAADANWNESFWKHERFNVLLAKARAELDKAKRQEMYTEMQKIMVEEGGTIIPMFANFVFATSDKISHGKLSAAADMDGLKFTERWWFA